MSPTREQRGVVGTAAAHTVAAASGQERSERQDTDPADPVGEPGRTRGSRAYMPATCMLVTRPTSSSRRHRGPCAPASSTSARHHDVAEHDGAEADIAGGEAATAARTSAPASRRPVTSRRACPAAGQQERVGRDPRRRRRRGPRRPADTAGTARWRPGARRGGPAPAPGRRGSVRRPRRRLSPTPPSRARGRGPGRGGEVGGREPGRRPPPTRRRGGRSDASNPGALPAVTATTAPTAPSVPLPKPRVGADAGRAVATRGQDGREHGAETNTVTRGRRPSRAGQPGRDQCSPRGAWRPPCRRGPGCLPAPRAPGAGRRAPRRSGRRTIEVGSGVGHHPVVACAGGAAGRASPGSGGRLAGTKSVRGR